MENRSNNYQSGIFGLCEVYKTETGRFVVGCFGYFNAGYFAIFAEKLSKRRLVDTFVEIFHIQIRKLRNGLLTRRSIELRYEMTHMSKHIHLNIIIKIW